ncbi:5-carboxymethyl-2-hydroxymuconate Delta-isomerase [Vibrio olivae]|uniref:5-carboxymethyl-2-hydroxymuconate Delta-isomerase n=1 Tax=Vibrio olivae TaxID=1243002 RepID=A0ABV5HQM8_9VIBR
MPHLVMEYSNSVEERLNIPGLLEDLHQVALDSQLFDVPSVKSRAVRCYHWLVGESADSIDFIHITFSLLEGRSEEQKAWLSTQLMTLLAASAGQVESLTVDIRDMDKGTFQRRAQ